MIFTVGGFVILVVGGVSKLISVMGGSKGDPGNGISLQADSGFGNGHGFSSQADHSGDGSGLRDDPGHDSAGLQADSGDIPGLGFVLQDDDYSSDGNSLTLGHGPVFNFLDDDSRTDGTGLQDDPGHDYSGDEQDYSGGGTCLRDNVGHGFNLKDDSGDETALQYDPGHGFSLQADISGYGTGLEDYNGHGFILQDDDSIDGTGLEDDAGHGFILQDDDSCDETGLEADPGHDFVLRDDCDDGFSLAITQDEYECYISQGKRIKHYSSTQKILLVGEGDFSFSACLARAFGSATNMVATSLDSHDFIHRNYGLDGWLNLINLKERGCKPIHGVDATTMTSHAKVGSMTFDMIVYNFPHAGFKKFESRASQLKRHRSLVRGFFENAKGMLSNGGEIHVSHKTNGFFREWRIEEMAAQCGLHTIEKTTFRLSDYPGYETKYGFGGNKNFYCYPSMTYKFALSSNMPNSLGWDTPNSLGWGVPNSRNKFNLLGELYIDN